MVLSVKEISKCRIVLNYKRLFGCFGKEGIMENVISIDNVTKEYRWEKKYHGFFGTFKSLFKPNYQTVKALDGVSLDVKKGEILGLLGPNGAGKSTIFKCMTGILKADDGTINVLGHQAWEERKKIVPQIGAFFGSKSLMWWNLPVLKTYELMKEVYNISDEDYERRLDFFEKIIGDREYMEKSPRQLSYGQRQRAEVITCLLHNPKIVFLDEPTLGLDIVAKESLNKISLECNKEFGTTFIVSTHDLKDIEKMCSRIVIINKGKIVRDSDAETIRQELLQKYVLTVDFMSDVSDEIFKDITFNAKLVTKRRISISISSDDINIYQLLERLNDVAKISTFEINYQTIEDVIKKYYLM